MPASPERAAAVFPQPASWRPSANQRNIDRAAIAAWSKGKAVAAKSGILDDAAPRVAARYHPALVALHWLMALLIVAMLTMGFAVLANTANAAPEKVMILRFHMVGGMVIFVLLAIRLVVRWRTTVPPRATSGSVALDRTARLVHTAFYLLIFVVAGSGFATAELSGLPAIVLGGSGEPLPVFEQYPSFAVHTVVTRILAATVVLHVLGSLYHHFFVKDAIFRRMGFGSRY